MELRDAAQRIFRVHRWLLCTAVVLGLLAGAAAHVKLESRTYTSSARLSLGGTTPQSTAEAAALAGTIQGIVTGPDRIRGALDAAHITRDAVVFAAKDVNTQPFSASGIMQLQVTDASPIAAATVANYLASDAVATLNTQRQTAIVALEDQLRTESDRLTAALTTLNGQLAASGLSVDRQTALLAARTDASQRLTAISTKQADVELQGAQQIPASVVDAAIPPDRPDPSRLTIDLILGLVAGLVGGLGGAAVWETLRPTAVGRRGMESALGAPVLAAIGTGTADRASQLAALSERARHVARRRGVSTVLLWSRRPDVDLASLRDELQTTVGPRSRGAAAARAGAFEFAVLDPTLAPEPRQGVLAVVPRVTSVSKLETVKDLCRDYDWPLLGVVIADRSHGRRSRRVMAARVAERERAATPSMTVTTMEIAPASTPTSSEVATEPSQGVADVAPLRVVKSEGRSTSSARGRFGKRRRPSAGRATRRAANRPQSGAL